MTLSTVMLPYQYFPNPTKGVPLASGDVYVGEPDTDPTIVANQKQIVAVQESGTEVNLSQPVTLGAGGVPLYNGSPVRLSVAGNYSIAVLNSQGAQVYYAANASETFSPVVPVSSFTESQTLSSGQTSVTFANDIRDGQFFIVGPDADNGRLEPDDDYTADVGTKTVTLAQSYPAGTVLMLGFLESVGTPVVDATYATVALMKAASIEAGKLVQTAGYYDGWDASLEPQGAGLYNTATLADVRTAKGDPTWVPDEYVDHTLTNGVVAMLQHNGVITPEQAGAKGDQTTDDSLPIQAAIDYANENLCILEFTKKYNCQGSLLFKRKGTYRASSTAVINGLGTFADGIILEDGNWNGQHSFPTVNGYTNFGVKIKGADVLTAYFPIISNCGDGLVCETRSATHANMLDSTITIQQIGAVTNAIVFDSESGCIMQGNEIDCNFISNCTSALLWRSTDPSSPDWDSNKVNFQAVDPQPANSGAVIINNPLSYAINRWVVNVETWAGGLPANGKFIDGKFNDLKSFINTAQSPNAGQVTFSGSGNKVDFNDMSNIAPFEVATTSNDLASYNGGTPSHQRRVFLKHTLASDLAVDASRGVYAFHFCADGTTNPFFVTPGTNANGSGGISIDRVFDDSATVDQQLIIFLENRTSSILTAGTVVYFTLWQMV